MSSPSQPPRPRPGRPSPGSPRPGGSRNTYDQMRQVLESQEAANEATRQAMDQVTFALSDMQSLLSDFTRVLSPLGPGGRPGGGAGPPVGGAGYSPHGYRNDPVTGHNSSYGRGYGGIRSGLARTLNSAYGAPSGSRYERIIDPTGAHIGWREYRTDGTVVRHDSPDDVSPDQAAAAARRGTVSNVLGSFGAGGLRAGLRAVPYVGAAVLGAEAIHEGATFLANQRMINSQYQSIYGGSNFDQYGQRASKLGFQFGQLFGGGLDWQSSNQAFQGVSALGYQGSSRDRDLAFITQNFKQMGVQVADSLKLIQTAAGDLNESLSGLQDGLSSTRDAAIATGMSGNVGTQLFTRNYQALSGQFAGGGVADISKSISVMQANMGRYMQGVNFANILTDPGQQAIMANSLGINPTQFIGRLQQGDPSVLRALDIRLRTAARPTLASQGVQSVIQRALQAMGPNALHQIRTSADPTNQLETISSKLMASGQLNAPALVAQFAASGVNVTPEQATELMLREGLGLSTPTLKPPTPDQSRSTYYTHAGGKFSQMIPNIDASRSGVNPTIDAAKRAFGDKGYGIIVQDGKHGGQRVVDLDTALKYYPDQIALGTARIRELGVSVKQFLGSAQKKYLYSSDYRRLHPDVKAGDVHNTLDHSTTGYGPSHDSAGTADSDQKTARGMSISAYDAMKTKDASKSGGGGTVTIVPGPELQGLLSFLPDGNVRIANSGAATGQMPRANYP